jgi:translation initiation factor IF-2
MGTRVHELAKKVGQPSKELIQTLKRLKIPVKNHMTVLNNDAIALIEKAFKAGSKKMKVKKAPVKKKHLVKKVSKNAQKTVKVKKEVSTAAEAPPELPKIKVTPKAEVAPKAEVTPKLEEKQEETLSPPKTSDREVKIELPMTVSVLAQKIQVNIGEFIKRLIKIGIWLNMTQLVEEGMLEKIGQEFSCHLVVDEGKHEEFLTDEISDNPQDRILRPPVVTFMGHVDHGKTSLLDAIRESKVVEKEAGKITQHIGAYSVSTPKGTVTFLDTPGHEAFTAMRARGANCTDVVVLVVAADDGIKPQTIEAIDHARVAEVPIIVAINKVDLPNADSNRVMKQLTEHDLLAEDWGGKTITVQVSAKTGKGIDRLLEMLLLEAEMLELKANPKLPARGVVVEAKLSKGRGPVATTLIQKGTLRSGDIVISGKYYGRIRAMTDDLGNRIKEAGPSRPVEIWGLSGVPEVGDDFQVVSDELRARELSTARQDKSRLRSLSQGSRISLERLYDSIQAGSIKELKIVLKTDVQGSVEAIRHSLGKLPSQAIKPVIIHAGVGGINESDVILALASNAIVIGFHVKPTPPAQALAEKEQVELRLYDVIYNVVNDVRSAMEGMLEPTQKEVTLGHCKILETFKASRLGTIAGCRVNKGIIRRNAKIHLIRNSVIIYAGSIRSLKRFKDDTNEVPDGAECGIVLTDYNDVKVGDMIEAYKIEKIARKL